MFFNLLLIPFKVLSKIRRSGLKDKDLAIAILDF